MAKSNILVLYAHPDKKQSRINQAMVHAISDIDNVIFHNLYDLYYDFYIDVKREQTLLLDVDLIIFQHPFYWYSSPALLKEWQDRVLTMGFAYGDEGNALQGKDMMSVISTGGKVSSYGPEGHNKFTVQELLQPFEATANLCGMNYLDPIIIQGSFDVTDDELNKHVKKYKDFLLQYSTEKNK